MGSAKKFQEGDLVECTFRTVFYPAKIIKIDDSKSGSPYLVHYQGWKKRWDEWVPSSRFKTSGSSSTGGSKKSSKISAKPLLDEKKLKTKRMTLGQRKKQLSHPQKRGQLVADDAKTEVTEQVPLQEVEKDQKISEQETVKQKDIGVSSKKKRPSFERKIVGNEITYTSTDGKVFKNLSEVKQYFRQKKKAFPENEFDFTLATDNETEPTMSDVTKKQKRSPKTKKVKPTAAKKANEQTEQSDKILAVQEIITDASETSPTPPKRKRGRPPKKSTTPRRSDVAATQSKKKKAEKTDEPMEMEISADVSSENERKFDKSSEKPADIQPSAATTISDEFPSSATDSSSNNARPARSRKPNQRFNILLSELDAMVRQVRRRRYSSKHSTTSGDETFPSPPAEQPLVVKIGSQKKKRESKEGSSPKRRKKAKSATESSEFDTTTPEFVEIQDRGQSPQEHDDGLPPVLGVSAADDAMMQSRSFDGSSPLADQICDVLPTTPSIESGMVERLIADYHNTQSAADRMRQFSSDETLTTSASTQAADLLQAELTQKKKRARKPSMKKSGDDASSSAKGKREKKQRQFLPSLAEPPPSITNEEIEEGLQTLRELEEQDNALQGIKVSSMPPISSGITASPRSPPQVILKVKPESRRGRVRRSANAEIPLLRRESEGAEYSGSAMGHIRSQAPPTIDEAAGFCYLPPEIMGDHCYGKSFPVSSGGGVATSSAAVGDLYHHHGQQTSTNPVPRTARNRPPVQFELLQRSPSPPPYKSSAFLADVGAYASYHRLEEAADYGAGGNGGSSVGSSALSASIMTGGQVPMLSDKMPANILEDDSDMNEEITSVDIQ